MYLDKAVYGKSSRKVSMEYGIGRKKGVVTMKYEGLLSFEEADKCIDTGQYPHWFVGYMGDGVMEILSRCAQGWIRAHTPSYMPVNQDDYLGLAPMLGNPLPMSTVRKDGRPIILEMRSGFIIGLVCCKYNNTMRMFYDNHYSKVFLSATIGWYPVIARITT